MALQKGIPTMYGTTASYWKITQMDIDWRKQRAVVGLSGYVDEKARQDDLEPISRKVFGFNANNFPFNSTDITGDKTNIISVAYDQIKRYPSQSNLPISEAKNEPLVFEFADAIDC